MSLSPEVSVVPDAWRVERVRHAFAARHMQLLSREVVSPGCLRLTLGGADLSTFRSDGFDDHVKVLFPVDGQERPLLPRLVDGRPHFDAGERPAARDLHLPEGDGFIWAAGEHGDMAALRRELLARPGVNPRRMRISAYWKRGMAAHHEELVEN